MAVEKNDVNVRLPNGSVITGKAEAVRATLNGLGYDANNYLNERGFYYSDSRGEYISITSMNTTHLRNAILKAYVEWLETLKSLNNKELFRNLVLGPIHLTPLINELINRKDE